MGVEARGFEDRDLIAAEPYEYAIKYGGRKDAASNSLNAVLMTVTLVLVASIVRMMVSLRTDCQNCSSLELSSSFWRSWSMSSDAVSSD